MSARKWKTSTWEGAHEGREVEEGVVGVGLGAEGGSHGGVGDGTVEGCAEGGYIGVWAGSGGCNADGLKCKRSGRGPRSKRGSKHLVRDPVPDWISG